MILVFMFDHVGGWRWPRLVSVLVSPRVLMRMSEVLSLSIHWHDSLSLQYAYFRSQLRVRVRTFEPHNEDYTTYLLACTQI